MECTCGRETTDGSSRCSECETSREQPEMQTCPTCTSRMQANAHFCLTCGTRIQRFAVVSDNVSVPYDEFAESELLRRTAERATSISSKAAIKDWPAECPSATRTPEYQRASGQTPGVGQPGTPPPTRRHTGLAVLIFTVISIAVIWWAVTILATKKSPTSPDTASLNAISNTRWRGNVGRSPASLDVFARGANGNVLGRISYEGIVEDLAIGVNAEGSIVLSGTGYHRESGTGPFALDTFYAQLSADARRLQGTLIDGSKRRGQWSVIKIDTSESLSTATIQLLSPDAVSHWQGTIGKWPASLDIFPRKAAGEWNARATYHGVVEDFAVTIKDDGSVVLAGQSYHREAGNSPFSLDTLYGLLSGDGQHLQGLRVDATSRGPWYVARTGSSGEPSSGPRALQDLSCSREGYDGAVQNDKDSSIEFVNDTSETRQLFWINYGGKRIFYKALEAHQSYVQDTFATHRWIVTDQNGTCRQVFEAPEGPAKAILQK